MLTRLIIVLSHRHKLLDVINIHLLIPSHDISQKCFASGNSLSTSGAMNARDKVGGHHVV
jgi:hypothetical protein